MKWTPLEILCGSIGLSLLLAYLVTFLFYALAPTLLTMGALSFSALAMIQTVLLRGSIQQFFDIPWIRSVLKWHTAIFTWTLLILCMVRLYSGSDWVLDWVEHFQRSLFFLHQFPTSSVIMNIYQIPARPPMMNLLAAFFMAQTEDRFEIFQLVFLWLNLLVFPACCLFLRYWSKGQRGFIGVLACFFALNPAMVHESIYTWTKAFTVFYVVMAIWFYYSGWKEKDFTRFAAASLALSTAMLVHYSAAPYVLCLALHFFVILVRTHERKWRELAWIVAFHLCLLGTWF